MRMSGTLLPCSVLISTSCLTFKYSSLLFYPGRINKYWTLNSQAQLWGRSLKVGLGNDCVVTVILLEANKV